MAIDDLLSRPDIAEAFLSESRAAQKEVSEQIAKAFADGAKLGRSQIDAELKHLGITSDYPDLTTSMYVQNLLADLDKNFTLLRGQVANAFTQAYADIPEKPFEKGSNVRLETARERVTQAIGTATKASTTLSHRAAAGATVAARKGFTDQQLEAYKVLAAEHPDWQIRKVWVANFVNNDPCPTCAALHGTTLSIDQMFSPEQTFAKKAPKIYQDLQGPPRHPNCKCRLSIIVEKAAAPIPLEKQAQKPKVGRPKNPTHAKTPVDKTPARMREYAVKQSEKLDFSQGISSQQIRDMPEPDFLTFLADLLSRFATWLKEKFRGYR
jgi:hypothetical protein